MKALLPDLLNGKEGYKVEAFKLCPFAQKLDTF